MMISHQLVTSATTNNNSNTNPNNPSSSSFHTDLIEKRSTRSTTNFNSASSRIPSELWMEIFNHLPPLSKSPDRLSVCTVCRAWLVPARIVLWRYLWLDSSDAVHSLAEIVKLKPDLAKLARTLRFSTDESHYLVNLDASAVFDTMEQLVNLESFEVLVTYCMGELYDSLCEELQVAPIKNIVLGADEGIGRSHVQASMRFEQLQRLELIRLGDLRDLHSLELDWVYPQSLVELVLVQPDLPGNHLRFLLSHTKNTLRQLRIDFGHLIPEETTQLSQEDIEMVLMESGSDLRLLELRWLNCTSPFLNDVIHGLFSLEVLITSGLTCDPGLIGQQGPSSLNLLSFDLKPGSFPSDSLIKLSEDGMQQHDFTKFQLNTTFYDPAWEQSTPYLGAMRDQKDHHIQREKWPDECIDRWKDLSRKLEANNVIFTTDFF